MNVRSHNFLATILPPSAIMILIDSFDIQFHWYQTHRRKAFAVCGVLHWKGGVCHISVCTVHALKTTLKYRLAEFQGIKWEVRKQLTLPFIGELAEDSLEVPSYNPGVISGDIIYA